MKESKREREREQKNLLLENDREMFTEKDR